MAGPRRESLWTRTFKESGVVMNKLSNLFFVFRGRGYIKIPISNCV